MPDVVPTHRLTHEASQKMIAAGVKKANELGCKVSLAVVDQSCRMIAFLMMDGARHFSIITTQRKAITSASQRMPTGYAPEENALSMAVREAVTNVVRHAQARTCTLRLEQQNGSCRLEIEDDGRGGFPGEGNGLRGMRERVEMLGGTLHRDSQSGTRLTITLPLKEVTPKPEDCPN